ncbi:MAG: hypothetical protein EOP04_19330 [Proteobacteria bacterium]|nr:MAG: hypothetical protein EOP04_19330 [Pseudomonadota bacterium]
MRSFKYSLISTLVIVATLSACKGSKGKSEHGGDTSNPEDPQRPGLPIVINPSTADTCEKLERDGIIRKDKAEGSAESLVKITISEGEDSKFAIECPGILTAP